MKTIFKLFKTNIKIFSFVILVFFLFTSCGSTSNVIKEFLDKFKSKNFEESYSYLIPSEEVETLKAYIQNLTNPNPTDDITDKIVSVSSEKIFDFDYEIVDEVIENNLGKVTVKTTYFNLLQAYKNALNEFLEKSLDFDNLDNFYESDTIINNLIKHIEAIDKEERIIEVNIEKIDSKWKIKLDNNLIEIFTGNLINWAIR